MAKLRAGRGATTTRRSGRIDPDVQQDREDERENFSVIYESPVFIKRAQWGAEYASGPSVHDLDAFELVPRLPPLPPFVFHVDAAFPEQLREKNLSGSYARDDAEAVELTLTQKVGGRRVESLKRTLLAFPSFSALYA